MSSDDQHETTLRDLRIFLAVCETGNLSRAGERLAIAQPSLSRTIRGLEERFHLRLFERHGRGVATTEAGAVFREHAERVVAAAEELEQRMGDLLQDAQDAVSVLLPLHVSHAIAPGFIRRFATRYPKASIDILEDNSNARIMQRVASGDADFGVFLDTSERSHRNGREIGLEEAYLVGLPGTIGTSEDDAIDFGQLAGVPLLLPRRRTPYRDYLESLAAQRGVTLNVVRELEMGSTLLAFVLEREGSTILPLGHFQQMLDDGRVVARRIENPRIARRMVLTRSTARPRKVVTGAIELFREALASAGPGWQVAETF